MTMPDYKRRKIELTPRRERDGTWRCPYRVIEFRQTCWGYRKGCLDGSFASREEAAAAALEEAKRVVDSLEPHVPLSELRSRGNKPSRLIIYFVQSVFHIGNVVQRSMFFFPNWRKIFSTITFSASSRR